MALRHMISRLTLGVLFVVLSTSFARCGDREDLMIVAEDIRSAIERQDPERILKYIHDTVTLEPDSFTPDELRQAFKDNKSWPNTMLFFGEHSIHNELKGKTAIHIQEDLYTQKSGFWQITLENPESQAFNPAFIFVTKHPDGWTITGVLFD